jgi:mannitol/fructose-specific phosphotransferase system IIA component (Ntr-type)
MRLRDHLRADLVLADLDARDRASALASISRHFAAHEQSLDEATVRTALADREAAHSTAMGHGLALPHATLAGLDETMLGIARSDSPIPWGDGDEAARLFFVLLSPPGSESTHIKLLARICRLVRIPGVAEDLLSADSAEHVVRVVLAHDEAHV